MYAERKTEMVLSKARSRVVILTLVVGACSGQVILAAAPTLRLAISSDVKQIVLLEALPVTVTIENVGSAPAKYDRLLFTGEGAGLLKVVAPDGTGFTVRQAQLRLEQTETHAEHDATLVTLAPGQRDELRLVISADFDHMRPVFAAKGLYTLSVSYEVDNQKVHSNQIRVTVAAPPASEAHAFALLSAIDTPEIIYEPGLTFISRWEKRLPQLEQLAALDGSAVYANYARLSLARRHIMVAERTEDQTGRRENLRAAQEFLDAIKSNEFTLAADASAAREKVGQLVEGKHSTDRKDDRRP